MFNHQKVWLLCKFLNKVVTAEETAPGRFSHVRSVHVCVDFLSNN